jgi:hypothetical protein
MTPAVMDRPEATTARWKAVIWYQTDSGEPLDVEHGIEELEELQDIVERGPDWNTILYITVTLDRRTDEGLTLEQAAIR